MEIDIKKKIRRRPHGPRRKSEPTLELLTRLADRQIGAMERMATALEALARRISGEHHRPGVIEHL